MPKIPQEASAARRDEVIDSCEALYQAESYHDITMTQIAEGVSFGRANIYNYFQNKDEVLLALMQREHDRWADDLDELASRAAGLSRDALADALALTLEKRVQMLKLLAMNLYDMEQNSRVESLVEFKRAYARVIEALRRVLQAGNPDWDEARTGRFVFAFMPFLHGAYPYAFHTPKQAAAMREGGIAESGLSLRELARSCASKLLQDG